MARSRAAGLSEALGLLEKSHGRTALVLEGSPMDFVMGILLSRNAPHDRAAEAVRRLTTEFVDWNEVRISYRREVAEVLAATGYEDAPARADLLLGFLGRLYKDKNGVDLAFLTPMEPEAVYAYFRAYPQIGDAVAAALVARLAEDGRVLDAPELLRVAQRLGMGGAKSSPAKVRKALEEGLKGVERIRAHYYLTLHSEGLCRVRAPGCPECAARPVCAHGRTVKAPAKPAKPPPAKEKKPAARPPAGRQQRPARKGKAEPAGRKADRRPARAAATPARKPPRK